MMMIPLAIICSETESPIRRSALFSIPIITEPIMAPIAVPFPPVKLVPPIMTEGNDGHHICFSQCVTGAMQSSGVEDTGRGCGNTADNKNHKPCEICFDSSVMSSIPVPSGCKNSFAEWGYV